MLLTALVFRILRLIHVKADDGDGDVDVDGSFDLLTMLMESTAIKVSR